jgi:hypothetical protein
MDTPQAPEIDLETTPPAVLRRAMVANRRRDDTSLGGMDQVVQTEVDNLLATNPEQRQAQLDILHDAFIPWLAAFGLAGVQLCHGPLYHGVKVGAQPVHP